MGLPNEPTADELRDAWARADELDAEARRARERAGVLMCAAYLHGWHVRTIATTVGLADSAASERRVYRWIRPAYNELERQANAS